MALLRATETFRWANADRRKFVVNQGDIVDSADPVVEGNERYFAPVGVTFRSVDEKPAKRPSVAKRA